jgi:hypothetical protein
VLKQGINGQAPQFKDLVSHPFVEARPGSRRLYYIGGSIRQELFQAWWPLADRQAETVPSDIPPDLCTLSTSLARYYEARRNHLERLYHLILADRDAALQLFDRLFQRADAAFDLPRCQAIIQILDERQSLLGTDLAGRLRVNRLRLETRSMWSQEYYKTVVYLERKQTRPLFKDLIGGRRGWILHLYASGGLGKTMYIRAVIARHCVPQGIPCAHIDFDFVPYMADVVREPWRLLLRIAEQLNVQLPNRPFGEMLRDYKDYIAQADKRRIYAPRGISLVSSFEQQQMRNSAVGRFIGLVQDVWSSQSLVLNNCALKRPT